MVIRHAYLLWLRSRLRKFTAASSRAREVQHNALLAKIARNADSDFGRDYGFREIRTAADFRSHVPVLTFEEHRPYINRVLSGDVSAMFAPNAKVLMFTMTSGTTGEPKRLPITQELFDEYKAGWQMWGAGVYGDHPHLMRRKTLQLSSDWQQFTAPSGIPCGQISGLAATTRPAVAQSMFLPPPATTRIHEAAIKHYTTLRFALANRNVGMIITANPSSLVEFARRTNSEGEHLIRDIHDGTLSCIVPEHIRNALRGQIARRNPRRARELEQVVSQHGALLPKHAWPNLSLLAVWTGGSIGMFLPRLAELYGHAAVRDHGLSSSEGRMTIPLSDNTPAGLLDFHHHYFEFIPAEEYGKPKPITLEAHELEVGADYYILLTTSGGLYRYDIHDVVRCVGYQGQAPLLEFLNKGKNFSNITGEKLSEYQVIRAAEKTFAKVGLPIDFFLLAPVMDNHPRYVMLLERRAHQGKQDEIAAKMQQNLAQLNEEYAEKCQSGRLLPIQIRDVPAGTWARLRTEKTGARGNFEEYKHICLTQDFGLVDRLTNWRPTMVPAAVSPVTSVDGAFQFAQR